MAKKPEVPREEQIRLGALAKEVSNNDAVKSVFAELAAEDYAAFLEAKTEDGWREAWHAAHATQRLQERLTTYEGRGTYAQDELDRQAKRDARVRA